MKKNPEQEKLQNYSEAISNLDTDEQLNKMSAVKSRETLKRFLSEDSPDVLVHRFSARLKDISDEDLNDYEMGRVHFALGKHDEAIRYFISALEKGEERANYYLGMLLYTTTDSAGVIEHLEKAVHAGQMSDMAAYYLAEFYLKDKKIPQALKYFHTAYDLAKPARKKFFRFRINYVMGEKPDPEKELTSLVEAGDLPTCMSMLRHFQNTKNKSGVEFIFKKLIHAGYVKFYVFLARYYIANNQVEEAAEAYRNAIRAGYTEHHINLINFLLVNNRHEDAYDACVDAINNGMYYAYVHIIAICARLNKQPEMLKHLSDAFFANVKEVEQLLDAFLMNPTVFTSMKNELIAALAKGEDFHPRIIEKFFGKLSTSESNNDSSAEGNDSGTGNNSGSGIILN